MYFVVLSGFLHTPSPPSWCKYSLILERKTYIVFQIGENDGPHEIGPVEIHEPQRRGNIVEIEGLNAWPYR